MKLRQNEKLFQKMFEELSHPPQNKKKRKEKGEEERRKGFPSLVCSAHCTALPLFSFCIFIAKQALVSSSPAILFGIFTQTRGKEKQMGWGRGERELAPQLK